MRKSNVDISKLPKFNSREEAKAYFERFGTFTYHGLETTNPPYWVYTYKRNNGVEYFIDIYADGTVVVNLKGDVLYKNF